MAAEETTRLLFVAAYGPAVLWALLVAVRTRRVSRGLMAAAFLWGALIAAPISQHLAARWRLDPVATAPVVEEALKAAPLVLLAATRVAAFDLLVAAALAGLGFSATENVQYMQLAAVQGGDLGLARAVYLRGFLQGLNHAVFTGAVAAGLGWARVAHTAGMRALASVLGFGAAVGQHALWNGLGSGAVTGVLCNALARGGPCRNPDGVDLFVWIPLIVTAVIGPGALALLAVAHRAADRDPAGDAWVRWAPTRDDP
jgi:RsiW-degrading membrane proteinase PrsW (M82 family)